MISHKWLARWTPLLVLAALLLLPCRAAINPNNVVQCETAIHCRLLLSYRSIDRSSQLIRCEIERKMMEVFSSSFVFFSLQTRTANRPVSDYVRFPKVYSYDDFEDCRREHQDDYAFCVVHARIIPDDSSELYRNLSVSASD